MTVRNYIQSHKREMMKVVATLAFQFHTDKEDLLQNGALKALKYEHLYNNQNGLKGFLGWWRQLLYGLCIDEYRKNVKAPPLTDTQNPVTQNELGWIQKGSIDERRL